MKTISPIIVLLSILSIGCVSTSNNQRKEIVSFGEFVIGEYTTKDLYSNYGFQTISKLDEVTSPQKGINYEILYNQVSGHNEYLVANYTLYGLNFDHVRLKFYLGSLYEISVTENVPELVSTLKKLYSFGFSEDYELEFVNFYDYTGSQVDEHHYTCYWEQTGNIHAFCSISYSDDSRQKILKQYFSIDDENISATVLQEFASDRNRGPNKDKEVAAGIYELACGDEQLLSADQCQQLKSLSGN